MENLKILVFDEEDLTKTLIESYLKDLTFPFLLEKYNEFDEKFFEDLNENKIIILNINKLNSNILTEISKFSADKKNNFIVISYDKSANISVQAFRNGAKDFLLKPLIKTDFLFAIQKIYNRCISQNTEFKSKIYTVSSFDKGEGKSTFLFNTAKEIADISKEKVLFLDFNDFTDNSMSVLETDTPFNTNYFINNLLKSNSIISKINRRNNSSLYTVTNNTNKISDHKTDSSLIPDTLNYLKKYFKYIFIDKNNEDCSINKSIEKTSDCIFYIITAKASNIRKLKDKPEVYKEKNITLVCNKYENNQEEKLEEIKNILDKEIEIKIPKNIMIAEKAFREHKTLKETEPLLDISETYYKTAKYIINRD